MGLEPTVVDNDDDARVRVTVSGNSALLVEWWTFGIADPNPNGICISNSLFYALTKLSIFMV